MLKIINTKAWRGSPQRYCKNLQGPDYLGVFPSAWLIVIVTIVLFGNGITAGM